MKKILLVSIFFIIIIAVAVFVYRYQIIQYSLQNLIRRVLPNYIKIEEISLDPKKGSLLFAGFKILNPSGFSSRHLLEVEEISCLYKMRGKSLIDGIEITEPVFKRPVLNIERLKNGALNLDEMKKRLENAPPAPRKEVSKNSSVEAVSSKILKGRNLSDIIKLPQTFKVDDGKVLFLDRLSKGKPHMVTIENIESDLRIILDDSYSKILSAGSDGMGHLNGDRSESIRWVVSVNPQTQKLTMSNRFEVSGLELAPFEPYYDRYSPFIFKSGHFSGTLIFDFDNGNIGSMNEIRLSDLSFSIKEGRENAEFWETTVKDLAKYFTSSRGDVVFDFKIKGEMSNPKFYLGSTSKQALAMMAIDKVSSAIKKVSTPEEEGPVSQTDKSDIEKAKEYIEFFKTLMEKKK